MQSQELEYFLSLETFCNIIVKSLFICLSFVSITPLRSLLLDFNFFAKKDSAFTSFGKQLPPKPHPGSKYETIPGNINLFLTFVAIRLSKETPFKTSLKFISPILSPIFDISFEKDIKFAKSEFDVYLISSAVLLFVYKIGTFLNFL